MNIKKRVKRNAKNAYFFFTSLFYRGNKLYCPMCQLSFRKMKPHRGIYSIKNKIIDHYTEDAHCPRCNLDIRHRLCYHHLSKFIHNNDLDILHFAPEYKFYKIYKSKNFKKYITADISLEDYADVVYMDAKDIPYLDNTFDLIIFNHILQFIDDDEKALAEMYRVLKPNGKLFLTVPIYGDKTICGETLSEQERNNMFGISQHLRLYGLDIVPMIERFGYSVDTIDLYATQVNFYNLDSRSPHTDSDRYLYICTKNSSNRPGISGDSIS